MYKIPERSLCQTFASEGEILRYNITSRTFDTFVLPEQLSLPVGLAVDNNGNLWATDHGTSIFYTLDTKSHNVTMFATSNASPKIYGLNGSSSLPEDAYTLLVYLPGYRAWYSVLEIQGDWSKDSIHGICNISYYSHNLGRDNLIFPVWQVNHLK